MDEYKTVEQIRKEYQNLKKALWVFNVVALLRNEHDEYISPDNLFWVDRINTYYEAGVDDRYAARKIANELKGRLG